MYTRRDVLFTSGALISSEVVIGAQATASRTYSLPALPYAADPLEPHIDAQTMTIHHDKHHRAYVDNLNKALAAHASLQSKPIDGLLKELDRVPEAIRLAVRNNGGGHYNHSLFWKMLAPKGGMPSKDLRGSIDTSFGSLKGFEEQFTKSALSVFGSGWAWLVMDAGRKLAVATTANQDSPISSGKIPLLGIDVWEHAYYPKYQNRRPEYVSAFLKAVNWNFVNELYQQGSSKVV